MTPDGSVFCTELSSGDKKHYSYEEAISKSGNNMFSFEFNKLLSHLLLSQEMVNFTHFYCSQVVLV